MTTLVDANLDTRNAVVQSARDIVASSNTGFFRHPKDCADLAGYCMEHGIGQDSQYDCMGLCIAAIASAHGRGFRDWNPVYRRVGSLRKGNGDLGGTIRDPDSSIGPGDIVLFVSDYEAERPSHAALAVGAAAVDSSGCAVDIIEIDQNGAHELRGQDLETGLTTYVPLSAVLRYCLMRPE